MLAGLVFDGIGQLVGLGTGVI
jgi:hypothetical protein